jgi:3-hydroxybutyryl-CoA dehydrogenase
MKNIVIAGSGVLGAQIAFQTAFHGYSVTVYDLTDEILNKLDNVYKGLCEAYTNDIAATPEQLEAAMNNLTMTSDLSKALEDADLLIEAIPEDIAIKTEFYQKAGKLAPEKTIFATNTSTLLPSQFAEATGRPEKFIALHFANEIWKRNFAEIMGHAGTSQEVFDQLVEFAKSINMVPLPLYKEQPGYINNSIMIPWINAAMKLWADDVCDYQTIDKTWMMGTKAMFAPFLITDIVGLNTAYNITMMMAQAQNDPLLEKVGTKLKEEFIDKGKLGLATGEGFYSYPNPEFMDESFLKP